MCQCSWNLVDSTEKHQCEHSSLPGNRILRGDVLRNTWGYIQYHCVDLFRLDEPLVLPPDAKLDEFENDAVAPLEIYRQISYRFLNGGSFTVHEHVDSLDSPECIMVWSDMLSTSVFQRQPFLFRSVRLCSRICSDGILNNKPPQSSIDVWRRAAGATQSRSKRKLDGTTTSTTSTSRKRLWEDILLELPKRKLVQAVSPQKRDSRKKLKRASAVDPIRLLRGLCFSQHLRDKRDFSKALSAARAYDDPKGEARDNAHDEGRSSM